MSKDVRLEGAATANEPEGNAWEVLGAATRLGLTSFGGPVAHIGYFRDEYVNRRGWLSEADYADLVALCQFLPGPASSQLGIAIGTLRAGFMGGLMAWLGFTLPSALILIAFAYGLDQAGVGDTGWLHGLKIAAVAVVAQAVLGMARSLTPDKQRITLAIAAALLVVLWQTAVSQILVIALGGLAGRFFLPPSAMSGGGQQPRARDRRLAIGALLLLVALLIGLPLATTLVESQALAVFDAFVRSGALVFGGGHVVLPLLHEEVVAPGWVTNEDFVAGYGLAQAVPGPLLTFAAYLGAIMGPAPNGLTGGMLALSAIFLPSFLLVWGALPFWDQLRGRANFRRALNGINAVVVGLLLAALYDPVWKSAIFDPLDLALALVAFGLLIYWRLPPWLVVALSALGGAAVAA